LKKATEIAPERPEMWGNLGITLFNARRFDEAVNALNKSASLDSNVAIIWTYLGLANFSLKRYEHAIPPLEKASELTPSDARILVNLGSCYQVANRIDEALATFRRAKQFANRYPGLSQQIDTIMRTLKK
jgi:Flp pilus assembly protein TadD